MKKHSDLLFQMLKNIKKWQIMANKLGNLKKNAYICTAKTLILELLF